MARNASGGNSPDPKGFVVPHLIDWLKKCKQGPLRPPEMPNDVKAELLNWVIQRLRSAIYHSTGESHPPRPTTESKVEKPETRHPINIFDHITDTDPGLPAKQLTAAEKGEFYARFYQSFYENVAWVFFEEKILPTEEDIQQGLPLNESFLKQALGAKIIGDAALHASLNQRVNWWILDQCRKRNKESDYGLLGLKIDDILKHGEQHFLNVQDSDNWRAGLWILMGLPKEAQADMNRIGEFQGRCRTIAAVACEYDEDNNNLSIKSRVIKPLLIQIFQAVGEPMSVDELRQIVAGKMSISKMDVELSLDVTNKDGDPCLVPESDLQADAPPADEFAVEPCAAEFIRLTGLDQDLGFYLAALREYRAGAFTSARLAPILTRTLNVSLTTVYNKIKRVDSLFDFFKGNDNPNRNLFADELIRWLEKCADSAFNKKARVVWNKSNA